MDPLIFDAMDDFALATLKKYTRGKWVDISLEFQEFTFAELVGRGDPAKAKRDKGGKVSRTDSEDGGEQLAWNVQVRNTGSFQDSELYGVDNTMVKDLLKQAVVPWTKQVCSFIYDVDELAFQSSREKVTDLLEVRRHSMFNDFFKGMEIRMWTAPTDSSANPRRPLGIPWWLQKSSSTAVQEFGFNGGLPSGFSDVAGISPTAFRTWKNGTFVYGSINDDDGLAKLAEAVEKSHFKPPHQYRELAGGMPDYLLYTVYSVYNKFQRLAKQQNDQIGIDTGEYYKGAPVFIGIPLKWVPALSDPDSEAYDDTDPIYGINWKEAKWCFHRDRRMIIHKPKQAAKQHTVREVFLDNWGQFKFTSRRSSFVGHKATT